jgi:hypothetical protein
MTKINGKFTITPPSSTKMVEHLFSPGRRLDNKGLVSIANPHLRKLVLNNLKNKNKNHPAM